MTVQAQTALLARLTGRPVRIVLNREESIRMHPKRHPLTMKYAVGCDADGRLTAAAVEHPRRFRRLCVRGRQGAGARGGPRLRTLSDAGARHRGDRRLYQQSALRGDARLRRQSDQLRHRGLPRPAGRQGRHRRLGDALAQCRCASATHSPPARSWRSRSASRRRCWRSRTPTTRPARKDEPWASPAPSRTAGSATARSNSANAGWRCRPTAPIDLYTGFTEMGQGLLTILTQCAVEVTGLPAAVFRPRVNSRFELGAGQTTGSRGDPAGRPRRRRRGEEAEGGPQPRAGARRPRPAASMRARPGSTTPPPPAS